MKLSKLWKFHFWTRTYPFKKNQFKLAVSSCHPSSKNLKVTPRPCWESSPRAS